MTDSESLVVQIHRNRPQDRNVLSAASGRMGEGAYAVARSPELQEWKMENLETFCRLHCD